MVKLHENKPEYFPNLRLDILEFYADRWANKYSTVPIDRIVLYRYSPLYPMITRGVPTKYAVEFEITTGERGKLRMAMLRRAMEICSLEINDFSSCEWNKLVAYVTRKYSEFESATTEYLQTVREKYPFSAFIDAGFSEVYNQLPQGDFRNEWIFVLTTIDMELQHIPDAKLISSIRREESFWVLFTQPSQVKELIKEVRPEIQLLYDAIKAVGFSGRSVNANEATWKGAALECFRKNKDKFNFIRSKHLEDTDLYIFSQTQEKRDFVGRLLRKVAQDQGLEMPNVQYNYRLYKSID